MTGFPLMSHHQQLQALRSRMARSQLRPRQQICFGEPALEPLFPRGGITGGSLVELLSASEGTGAWFLALLLSRQLQRQEFTIVLIDHHQEFFPPGAAQRGIDLDRLIVVQPRSLSEQLWTIEQVLRCNGRTVVISSLGRVSASTYRRLKLAAERGGGLGLFVREATLRTSPSWADSRLLVEPAPSLSRSRRYKVTAHSLEGTEPECLLEVCHATGAVSVVPQLACATTPEPYVRAS